jgi:hypothetical protein
MLPLKIHTGSSRAIYSYWVEKALLFPNWSSFSRQLPSPYVSNFRRFSLYPEGGGREVWTGGICSLPAGPVRHGKKSGCAGGPVQQAVPDHAPYRPASTARIAGRASTGGLKVRSVGGRGVALTS